MEIALKNVGIIKDSKINIDGITVITGKNNSGKSTIGKAIYSLISSTENLYENGTRDIVFYAENILTKKLRSNNINVLCRGTSYKYSAENELQDDKRFLLLRDIYNQKYPDFSSLDELKNYIVFVIDNLESILEDDLYKIVDNNKVLRLRMKNLLSSFIDDKNELISGFIEVNELIDKYSDFVEYERKKVLFTLLKEFNNQIFPVKINEKAASEISISSGKNKYSFQVFEKDHEFADKGELLFNETNNVVFIDDVTIVDSVCPDFRERRFFTEIEDFESYIHYYDHKISLINKLTNQESIIKSIIDDDNYRIIESKIDSVMKDDITVKDGKFVCASDNLDLANLAMGSKLFAIIKMLLKNGSINKGTILILDEPEAHLHPEWQNILAEIISVLVSELGIRVVITSHSPNFVLAIQTYSIKYDLNGVTNYYKTQSIDGYRVSYEDVSNDLTPMYSDFAQQFSSVKALYDSLVTGECDG